MSIKVESADDVCCVDLIINVAVSLLVGIFETAELELRFIYDDSYISNNTI